LFYRVRSEAEGEKRKYPKQRSEMFTKAFVSIIMKKNPVLIISFPIKLGKKTKKPKRPLAYPALHVFLGLIQLVDGNLEALQLAQVLVAADVALLNLHRDVLEEGVEAVLGRDQAVLRQVLQIRNDLAHQKKLIFMAKKKKKKKKKGKKNVLI
jgi:hypothetical protein